MDLRIDLKIEKIEQIDDNHFTFRMVPDPKRYELKTINGKKGYWDKFDEVFISLDVFGFGTKFTYTPFRCH